MAFELIPMSDLNRHILDFCELHEAIDRMFAASSFAKHVSGESWEIDVVLTVFRL